MTNEEAKHEAALLKWEEAGFIRNQIEPIIQKDGGIKLNHPSLKTSLIGYCNAHDKGLLKAYNFDGDSLYVWNKLLDGIENNNGWIRIEPNGSNLPEHKKGRYEVFDGKQIHEGNCYYNADFNWWEYVSIKLPADGIITHYKPVKEEPKPIY